jgi:hypothetical protein
MELLPAALPGTALRVLATTDLAAELIPRRVSWGESGPAPGRNGARPVVRGWSRVPAVRPRRATPATDALDAAAASVVGESRHT